MAKHSARGDETRRNSADDEIIHDLDALKRKIESEIPKAVLAVLTDNLTDDSSSTVAWRLYRIAVVAVSALFELAKTKPSLLRLIAEISEAWPAFISPHQDYVKTSRELIERIGVGKKHFLRLNFPEGKRGKRRSPRSRSAALNLRCATIFIVPRRSMAHLLWVSPPPRR